MPLSWAETKKVIREVCRPALLALGFPNPGISSWRYREHFIDVAWFYYRPGCFRLDIGCHPRKAAGMNLLPLDCMFRIGSEYPSKDHPFGQWIPVLETIEEQRELVLSILPKKIEIAGTWLAKFTTLEEAVHLLETLPTEELDQIYWATRFSPAYEESLVLLKALIAGETKAE